MMRRFRQKKIQQNVCVDRRDQRPLISSIYSSTSKSAPSRIPGDSIYRVLRGCAFLDQQPSFVRSDFDLNVVMHPEALSQMLRDGYLASFGDSHIDLA